MNCYLNYDKTAVEINQTWRISSHFRLEPNAGLYLKYIITRLIHRPGIYTMGFVNTCYVVNEALKFYEHQYDPKMSIYYKKNFVKILADIFSPSLRTKSSFYPVTQYRCLRVTHVFICLFGFSAQSRIFHSYGGVTITCEGLQILTYTRQ